MGQSVTSMATQILGHTQQGVQGMLSTEGRPGLLPLVIYTGSDLLEPRHVLEVATRCVGQYRVTISRKGWAVVSDRLAATVKRLRGAWLLSAPGPSTTFSIFLSLLSSRKKDRRQRSIVRPPSNLKSSSSLERTTTAIEALDPC
jgi:hypothetical protein